MSKHARILGCLLFFSSMLGLCQPTALAQKPVVTRNADEPGRNPYRQNVFINQTSGYCPNPYYCVFTFNAVPAGYRLVVTYASARFSVNAGAADVQASLQDDSNVFGTQVVMAPPVSVGGSTYISGSPITFYVDAGKNPTILISASSIETGYTAQASIAGYLVALP